MKSNRNYVKKIPVIGVALVHVKRSFQRSTMFVKRLKIALTYFKGPTKDLVIWLYKSRECTNFTYDLTAINKCYLASVIASITGRPYDEIFAYIVELEDNGELRDHITRTLAGDENRVSDAVPRYGRRAGWYAFVRATKPKVVVETGVDKGLGSCVLTAALMRNDLEGFPGFYYGTDINPKAGFLFSGEYSKYGEILYGDSIESLEKLDQKIDLLVNDSDHSAVYEGKEYETISAKLNPFAIVLGDNSHHTDRLFHFAAATGREFIFFQEKPYKHWYPGAGIGIAFRKKQVESRRYSNSS